MRIDQLSPGQTVYDVHSERMGNTTTKTMGCWDVRIKEVDLEKCRVLASWNGNSAKWFYGPKFSWRKEKPVFVKCGLAQRLETRAEKKARLDALKETQP